MYFGDCEVCTLLGLAILATFDMLVSQRTGFLFNLSFQQERWFPKVVKFFEHLKCLHVD